MEKNSFTSRSSGEPRASTAVSVERRPWDPRVRRPFSSREQVANRENARQLEDYISRIDGTPSLLNEDSRLHRPFSNSRFAATCIESAEVPGVEPDQLVSLPQSQDNLTGQHPPHENRTGRPDSQGNRGSESHQSTPVISSYDDIQEVIDSSWSLKQIPERYQDGFDRMKEHIQNTTSELSKERQRSSRLSRDVDALRQELDEVWEREKAAKIQIANQDKALKVEASNVEKLCHENEKLKELSRRDHEENEKVQSKMKQEVDALLKDLGLAKQDIRYKDKFVCQIQRDVKNAKETFDEEVRRREATEIELNAAKQDYSELEASNREAESQWKVLREENEARITKLEGINESQREQMSELEVAIEKQKETTKAVESDFVEMVSFLHRISRAFGQVFRATSIHGRLSVPVTIDFPVSALILEGQEERYDIFKKLTKALNCRSSLSVALELANPYDDVLKDFFRIVVIRLVPQTEYICTKEDTLRQTESCHALIRACLEEQRRMLQELRANFSSALSTMRQETMRSTEQLCLKVKQVEEERKRVALALHAERGKSGVIKSILGRCKESLFHEKATLLDLKESTSAHYQELKSRISADVSETRSCRSTLEELKGGIESLFEACSISREKSKNAEDILKSDLERLRTALADKEEKIKD